MTEKRSKIIGIVFFVILGLIVIIRSIDQGQDQWRLKNYGEFTTGKLTKVTYYKRGKYNLHYEFIANRRWYKGTTLTHAFECVTNTKRCIGKEFKISYDPKNPKNNDIYLDQYENYKARILFFNVDWIESNMAPSHLPHYNE